ncbi:hypothetical protein [Haloarchaeobius sp. DYHT-AS-18]|uniref:DUF7847 domain-containing protein n=1 Tax=Haloarchaeobius sp. DYHT-AS-18 TaxID=3446117 RepID=UPI003EB82BB2
MGAIAAAKHAGQSLIRNPVIFVATLGLALVQVPQQVLQYSGLTIAGSLYSFATLAITPLFTAGILSMAYEGMNDSTSLGTFVDGVREHYLTLFLSTVLYSAIFVAVGIAAMFLALFVGVFAFGVSAAAGSAGLVGLGLFVVFVAVIALAIIAISMVLQFYAPAIVVDDADIGESFTRSYRFATDNLASVVGFSVIKVLPALFAGGAAVALVLTRYYEQLTGEGFASAPATTGAAMGTGSLYGGLSVATFVALVLLGIASTVLLSAFTQTYLVTFYVEQTDSEQRGVRGYEEEYDLPSGY